MTSAYVDLEVEQAQASDVASEPAAPSPQTPRPRPLQLLKRFSILLPTMLASGYLALWAFYPWRPLAELDTPGWIVDFADQVDLMMTARNPPIVVLGSSLILAAPRRLHRPNIFQDEISKAAGKNIAVSCMAVPGAIASDQDFILEQLLEHGKKPSLVIYTFAPRDFMDNTIEGKISGTATRRVLTLIDRRRSFLPKRLTMSSLHECGDNHIAFLDSVRRHVLHSARNFACRISGHPDSLWTAAQQRMAISQAPQSVAGSPGENCTTGSAGPDSNADESPAARAVALAKDLELYDRRYNPLNRKKMDEQFSHLQNLLTLAKINGIKVEIVGMPLSPANLRLLSPGILAEVQRRVADLADRYDATLVDFNAPSGNTAVANELDQDDYLDSAHLSTPGARAFMPVFTKSVVGSSAFEEAFPRAAKK